MLDLPVRELGKYKTAIQTALYGGETVIFIIILRRLKSYRPQGSVLLDFIYT
jgi:hypothetical protein